MNQEKIVAAGKIILESALEMLAEKNKTTPEIIRAAILENGNTKLAIQLRELLEVGIDQTIKMQKEGEISLV